MSDRTLLDWTTAQDEPAVSVVFGRNFIIDPRGACKDEGSFALQEDLEYYPEEQLGERTGYIRPSLLLRDVDLWPHRARTDLVIQGTARSQRPVRTLPVGLTVRGSAVRFSQVLQVSGDRVVEAGPTGPRVSEAAAFEAMPLRYDKAYGGTDERALAADPDREEARMIYDTVGEAEDREISAYSYPRNPAGKGYVIDPESIVGTQWPNIELPDELLKLERIAAPRDAWGDRPYPGGFDWFPHAWFPRSAFFGEMPPIAGDAVPKAELALGVLPADYPRLPLFKRPRLPFAQGAHPRLWRHRWLGDERLRVDAIGADGAPLEVALPGVVPEVRLRLPGEPEAVLAAELDLVLVAADARRVTLLWRATQVLARPLQGAEWKAQTSVTIRLQRR